MYKKYSAIANTKEQGLVKGQKYIVESLKDGTVYVYDLNEKYLMRTRLDNFDNYVEII